MKEIELYFSALLKELEKGRNVMAVTLVNSRGSAPRRAGARMLIGEDGRFFGTIGGGAVEFRVVREAAEFLEKKRSLIRQYDLSPKDRDALGMICGGAVTAAFHYIGADREDVKALCRTALLKLCAPCRLWLSLELPDSAANLAKGVVDGLADGPTLGAIDGLAGGPTLGAIDGLAGGPTLGAINDPALKVVNGFMDVLQDGSSGMDGAERDYRMALYTADLSNVQGVHRADGGKYVYLELISEDRLVHLFGGGHVARELAPLLTKTGFSYAVYDDRKEYLKRENFPDAVKLSLVSFDRLEGCLVPAADHYFVIMTRGHQFDFQAQAFAMGIRERTSYIGVIGSRKKTASLEERLARLGISREALDWVHAPIGLPIGAETPAEIAVSIAAQLIQIRNAPRQ